MKIGIANDHHGVELNHELTNYLIEKGYNVINYGPTTTDSVDYPIYSFKLGEAVAKKDVDFGIAICSSGIGVSIACNKVKGVRCAKVSNVYEAKMTRRDNDANVIALSARLDYEEMKEILLTFLTEPYANLERYNRRIEKIDNYVS